MENELSQEVVGDVPDIPPETPPAEEAVESTKPEPHVDEEPELEDAETLEKDIEELKAKKAKAEADAKRWAEEKRRQRNLYMSEKHKAPAVEPEQPAAAPKEDDFENFEDYEAALHDYKIEQAISRKEAEKMSSQATAKFGEFVDNLIFEGREKYSDFTDIAQSEANPLTKQTLEILQDADYEHPADICYYLGKNLAESVAISRMSPTAAARALAKIEAKVAAELEKNPSESKPTTPKKTVTEAPEPIVPSGSGGAPITKDPGKMSQAEYEAWRLKGGGR